MQTTGHAMLLQKLGETGVGETGDSLNSGPAVTASIREGLPTGYWSIRTDCARNGPAQKYQRKKK